MKQGTQESSSRHVWIENKLTFNILGSKWVHYFEILFIDDLKNDNPWPNLHIHLGRVSTIYCQTDLFTIHVIFGQNGCVIKVVDIFCPTIYMHGLPLSLQSCWKTTR